MSDFNRNWRRQQELRMRPFADIIYRHVFGKDIDIQRFDRDDNKLLDIQFAIDVQLRLANGQILLGQEKYLSSKFAKYNSFTVEYMQNPMTKEKGDWFKIATQFYFVGYCTENMNGFNPWIIVNWPSMVIESNNGNITWTNNTNKADGARASFVYANMSAIPEHCVISCSFKE